MAKAILLAQKTIDKQKTELEEKNRFINQIAVSKNSLLVREVAKAISKSDTGLIIGEKRLYEKLRSWDLICKKSTEPKQTALERGLFEVAEGTRTSSTGVFTYQTTRETGKGQTYILNRLLKEQSNQISMIN
jgi:anti-repressor protein